MCSRLGNLVRADGLEWVGRGVREVGEDWCGEGEHFPIAPSTYNITSIEHTSTLAGSVFGIRPVYSPLRRILLNGITVFRMQRVERPFDVVDSGFGYVVLDGGGQGRLEDDKGKVVMKETRRAFSKASRLLAVHGQQDFSLPFFPLYLSLCYQRSSG